MTPLQRRQFVLRNGRHDGYDAERRAHRAAAADENRPTPPTATEPSALIVDHNLMGNRNARVSMLDLALQDRLERCPVPLYRAMRPMEVTDQGDQFHTDAYTSFSESPAVALRYAQDDDAPIMVVENAVALPYHRWLRAQRAEFLRAGCPVDATDARLDRAEREREWVVGPGYAVSVDHRGEGSGLLQGRTVMRVTPKFHGVTPAELIDYLTEPRDDPGDRVQERAFAQNGRLEDNGIHQRVVRVIPHDDWDEREEVWTMPGNPATPMRCAYNHEGAYIGDPDEARHLIETLGIRPELIDPEHSVCSVGYCPNTGRWHGWSHRAMSDFPTRDEAVRFAQEVASVSTNDPHRAEVASAAQRYRGVQLDTVFLRDSSDVLKRYDSMVQRRATAAQHDQPRVVQRLDKMINILRGALHLPPEPPTPVRTSGRAFDQNVDTGPSVRLPWDRQWMRSVTTACLASWTERCVTRGLAVSRERAGDGAVRWVATGAEAGRGAVRYELIVVGNGALCTEARFNGLPLALFGDDGAVAEVAGEQWSGSLSGAAAQRYALAWSRLMRGDY